MSPSLPSASRWAIERANFAARAPSSSLPSASMRLLTSRSDRVASPFHAAALKVLRATRPSCHSRIAVSGVSGAGTAGRCCLALGAGEGCSGFGFRISVFFGGTLGFGFTLLSLLHRATRNHRVRGPKRGRSRTALETPSL